jgi:hypothetical protein
MNPGANMLKKCISNTTAPRFSLNPSASIASVTFDMSITMMLCASVATAHDIMNMGLVQISRKERFPATVKLSSGFLRLEYE